MPQRQHLLRLLIAAVGFQIVGASSRAVPFAAEDPGNLRVGAAAIDITPTKFPIVVNGGFEERTAEKAFDPLHARALVFDDGKEKLAIVVVDSAGLPRGTCDAAKKLATERTGIPADRILISATHTHSAPSAWPALGTDPDQAYVEFLIPQIARSIDEAAKKLAPARIGFATIRDDEHTHCRQWIRRPDRIAEDPFGQNTTHSNMHPGHVNPDTIGPSGPVDPFISLLAVQSLDGKPLAVLANYSMHYYDAPLISADYYGHFTNALAQLIGQPDGHTGFVGVMSQGTSGDSMWMDYGKPQIRPGLEAYAAAVAKKAFEAYEKIEYKPVASIAMREALLKLDRRVPDEKRLAWAQSVVATFPGRKPHTLPEVYAREQIFLHDDPTAELKLQAIRIGDVAIVGIPNEVFGITGLKLKGRSPLVKTFNIGLANGVEGYIPPPEQHPLGGYTTWTARSAGLEVQAEPKIVEGLLKLLEEVSGHPQRKIEPTATDYAAAVARSKPSAYWRLDDITVPTLADFSGNNRSITLEEVIVPYLDGAPLKTNGGENRAAHFVGGRLKSELAGLGNTYTAECWIWNGLPHEARNVTGYFFSRGPDGASDAPGDHLAIGGTFGAQGRLVFFNGNQQNQVFVGKTPLELKTWYHVAFVRDGKRVTVYLNGNRDPEIVGDAEITLPADSNTVFFGARNDKFTPFEGKLDELAVYDRALTADEVAEQVAASGVTFVAPANPAETLAADLTQDASMYRPRSPEVSMASIQLVEDFQIELVAAEPLVFDPVAIDWGPDGKLWVAEMADYPLGLDGKMKSCGRIRYLEDTNGDGSYDRSTLFMDGVNFPNGVMAWRGGVLVTAAPEIFFAEDTNGDGRADKREVLYEGFNPGNPQLRVNGLQWGLDGWVYCANGWSGGKIKSNRTGAVLNIQGRDLRIQPDTGGLDLVAGQTEFGRNRDDWGNWFGCDNSYPLWHFALEERYIRRNPHFAPPDARHHLVLPANPPVFAISKLQKRFFPQNHDERYTSACSAVIYRDNLLFPRGDEQHAFICEPVHNLIQHRVVTPSGVSFEAHRTAAEEKQDFLASSDPWFRPTMVRTGPDGALWVVDMYRYMIEHPEWLPPEGKAAMQPYYRFGEDRGRIYRIVRKGQTPRKVDRLDKLTSDQLVARLESTNGIERDLAHRMLVWRNDATAAPAIAKLTTASPDPIARVYALSALELLGLVSDDLLMARLTDENANVRKLAVQLAERRGDKEEIAHAVFNLAGDESPIVRMQLANLYGSWQQPAAAAALAKIAASNPLDDYFLSAIATSLRPDNIDAVLNGSLAGAQKPLPAIVRLLLQQAVAFEHDETVCRSLLAVLPESATEIDADTAALLRTVMSAYAKRHLNLAERAAALGDVGRDAAARVARLGTLASHASVNDQAPATSRIAAIRLLGFQSDTKAADLEKLISLFSPQVAPELQLESIRRLAEIGDAATPQALFTNWRTFTPSIRQEAIAALLSRPAWLAATFEKLESSEIAAADFDATTRQVMLNHRDEAVRNRAGKIFVQASSSDRAQVLETYKPVLTLSGDAARGAALFKNKCATCHKLDGVGYEVGPNLASLSDKSPAALLTAILDPSRGVETRFMSYIVATSDGRTSSGILAAESGTSITLLGQEGKLQSILRSEIEQLASTGKSLMPEGLEKELSAQDVADVIAFVAGPRQAAP